MSHTVSAPSQPTNSTDMRRSRSRGRTVLRFARANPLAVVGFVVIVGWIILAVFAPSFLPYSPLKQAIRARLQPPSADHLFGTDELGRDVFTRIIYGAQTTLPACFGLVIGAGLFGTILGTLAGYIGGLFDEVVMRVADLFLAFPGIILAMAIAAALGPELLSAIIAISIVWWPGYARLARSLVRSGRAAEYVDAARAIGAGDGRILLRHIVPGIVAPLVVMGTLDFGNAVLTFSGLSFLGLGVRPPAAEWGSMVAAGTNKFDQWWLGTFPGLAILTVVLAFNFIGDGLRDFLDPRLRGRD